MLNDITADFLCEIGVEELPSGSVQPLGEAFMLNVMNGLKNANITYTNVRYFATPRRLAVYFSGVLAIKNSESVTRRGPAYATSVDEQGNPLPALVGFARSCGVGVDALSVLKTDKGSWWIYESQTSAVATNEILPKILHDAITQLPIKKLMRWGLGEFEFVRPVHWVLALWNNTVIDFDLFGVKACDLSHGHRFHHPQAIKITSPDTYEAELNTAFVVADFAKRRQIVIDEVTLLAKKHGYTAIMPDALVDEVTSIIELPSALIVPFDSKFLAVPQEALITAMQVHQKCFALQDSQNKLQPYFITVANINSKNPLQVINGNKQVMHARLSDAAFFYQQDQKRTLISYLPETALVVLQEGLGSLADQATRLQRLLQPLITSMHLNAKDAQRAAQLSQCDLLTGMVGEFPELQGIMGYYYALNDGEERDVALALREQYYPRFAADVLPESPIGLALSLVTRLDLLVGAFLLGKKPSGVKDPFKLRRHALALVRLMLNCTPLKLSELLDYAVHGYPLLVHKKNLMLELKTFIWERLQSFYQNQNVPSEVIQAVRACEDDCLFDVDKRIKAVLEFQLHKDAKSLSSLCKRVGHLLQSASISDNMVMDEKLFQDPAEIRLFECVRELESLIIKYHAVCDYQQLLQALLILHDPVDQFFTNVLVNVDNVDLKNNRLSLLLRIQRALLSVADLSLLGG